MAIEVTVILKGEDKTFKEKHLIYDEGFSLSTKSHILQQLIEDARDSFKCEVEDVVIKATMQWE